MRHFLFVFQLQMKPLFKSCLCQFKWNPLIDSRTTNRTEWLKKDKEIPIQIANFFFFSLKYVASVFEPLSAAYIKNAPYTWIPSLPFPLGHARIYYVRTGWIAKTPTRTLKLICTNTLVHTWIQTQIHSPIWPYWPFSMSLNFTHKQQKKEGNF